MSQPVEEKSAEASEDKLRPYDARMLDVGDGHWIYVEEVGRADGIPALFLHGGTGQRLAAFPPRGCSIPSASGAVLFDQRGSGPQPSAPRRSRPTRRGTSSPIIERVREHFGIERWFLVGGSWGSTLALAYAQTHPDRVLGLVLRAVFLGTAEEVRWAFVDGPRDFPPRSLR